MDQFPKAIILGIVQGITEFLPISSTGHLIIFEKLLGVSQETYGLTFDAALHLGTLIAVLWFFREEWVRLFFVISNKVRNLLRMQNIPIRDDKLINLLVIGTIPAVILGLLLEDVVDSTFRSPILVGISLILFSAVLWYVEKMGQKKENIDSLSKIDSFLIGTAQAIALIPGVSRSGITIASGMWRGLTREQATRFAFLLSAPIIAGAGGKKMIDFIQLVSEGKLQSSELFFFAAGIISAAISGYLTIKYFIKYVSKVGLMPFVWYRIAVGILILLTIFNGSQNPSNAENNLDAINYSQQEDLNQNLPVTLDVPDDWSVAEQIPGYRITTFYSPDFKSETTHITQGMKVTIYEEDRSTYPSDLSELGQDLHDTEFTQIVDAPELINIDGQESSKFFLQGRLGTESDNTVMIVLIPRGDHIYSFACEYAKTIQQDAIEQCNQILKTWKFLD